MSIFNDVENSAAMQEIKSKFMAELAKGEGNYSDDYLDYLHDQAQRLRANAGYTADDEGRNFTIIQSAPKPTAAPQPDGQKTAITDTLNSALDKYNVDGEKVFKYAKFGAIALIIITIVDRIF